MKPSLSRLPTLLILLATILPIHSCKSLYPNLYTIHHDSIAYAIHKSTDTVLLRDSVFIREQIRGDTVYLTRTEYHDRWCTRVEHDTIIDVRVKKEIVQLPPERYIPKFYKISTTLLYIFITLVIGSIFIKIKIQK